jgi:G3E family GTPase
MEEMATGQTVFVALSGFLGAGKTTLMLSAANILRARGLTVACVTNDQGDLLIDSNMVETGGFPLGQVRGGCYCCKFNELVDTLNVIMAIHHPDVILAEAVGSCTDLTATVILPLKSLHGDMIQVRPLTTVIDALRLEEMLSVSEESESSVFSPEIDYIYLKQLEEAACLLLNKTDLIPPERLARLTSMLRDKFPGACILPAASLNGQGVDEWLDHILSVAAFGFESGLDIDYDLYADGEAQLGWLNAALTTDGGIDDVVLMCQVLTSRLAEGMNSENAEIAHLKLLAQDNAHRLKMSVVRSGSSCQMDVRPNEQWSSERLSIWINARIHMNHTLLEEQVLLAMEWLRSEFGLEVSVHELECFAPARPVPTHRIS